MSDQFGKGKFDMGERGVEPPRVAPTAPKAVAFASFATRPNGIEESEMGREGIEPSSTA